MSDRALAGYESVGSIAFVQLYAGEKDTVSTHGTVKSNQVLGTVVSGRVTVYPVVALVAGKLVRYNPAGNDGSQIIYGILPHPLDTSPTGTNADEESPVFIGGVFNFDALDKNGATLAQMKAACAVGGNADLVIQDLY